MAMAMEGDDGMDSLFAGMDFVNPLSFSDVEVPLSSPPPQSQSALPLHPHDFSNQDEDLSQEPSLSDQILEKSDQNPLKIKTQSSIDSILAAYGSVNSKTRPSLVSSPSFSKQSLDASKPGVRRKKRSVKIGYGRSANDADEIRSSGHDETASNGSAVDDQINGFPEVISVGHDVISVGRYDEVNSSIGNSEIGSDEGIVLAADALDANQAEPLDNLNVVSEPLDNVASDSHTSKDLSTVQVNLDGVPEPLVATATLDSKTSEVKALSIGSTEGILVEHPADEGSGIETLHKDGIAETSSISAGPPRAGVLTKVSTLGDNDIGAANTEFVSSNTSSDTICPESETDVPDLGIRVPHGFSIEERLLFIKSAVARNAQWIQQRIAGVSQARKAAAQKRRQAGEKVSITSAKFKEIEEEIEAACEREDFEKAERLSEALAVAEKSQEAALKEFRAAETEYDKYASKMQEVIQMQAANEEEGSRLLEQLGQDASDTANHVKEDAEEKGRKEMDALTAEEEAVKLKKNMSMLEVRVVEEAKSELSSAIERSIQTELQEKKNLVEERQVLLEELDALLAAVRLKETQITEHDKKIGDLEEKINSTMAGFEKESLRLEADLQNLMSVLDCLEKESEDLSTQKIQVEGEVAQAQEEEKKLFGFSSIAKIEAQKLQDALQVRKSVSQTALSSKEKRLSLATQEKQQVEAAQNLRSQSSSLRISLQELASERAKLHKELLSANQQIISMEKRGPEIEAEKKLAAASRNFKEAGRLATEAKALLSSKERVASDLKRITADLQRLDQELESQMSELSELDNQVLLKEKEAAMARCERLRLLAAATRDERDAAAELEDFEEAESLHVEAEAADQEADELQKQYGFEGKIYVRTLSTATPSSISPGLVDSKTELLCSEERTEDSKESGVLNAEVDPNF